MSNANTQRAVYVKHSAYTICKVHTARGAFTHPLLMMIMIIMMMVHWVNFKRGLWHHPPATPTTTSIKCIFKPQCQAKSSSSRMGRVDYIQLAASLIPVCIYPIQRVHYIWPMNGNEWPTHSLVAYNVHLSGWAIHSMYRGHQEHHHCIFILRMYVSCWLMPRWNHGFCICILWLQPQCHSNAHSAVTWVYV